jgi:putative Mg2+ transporter-C (MgtC) family protein
MPLDPTWPDIALRLALSVAAGALIGFNRESHGHAAGLRTTLLVCLAAAFAMVLANLLLGTAGKTEASFVRMDVMRLPLGVLTGVGFIGGGAILRRDTLTVGVTTAATLWMVTVVGLCFGSGAIGLGLVATAVTVIVLWVLKRVDRHIARDQRASLTIRSHEETPTIDELRAIAAPLGCRVRVRSRERDLGRSFSLASFYVLWRSHNDADPPSEIIEAVHAKYPRASIAWKAQALD